MKNFIRSLFCHTTINEKFNSRNYILTKICSGYIIEWNRTYFRKKGAYIMKKEDEERKEMSRERMEEKEILDLYRHLNKNQKQRIKIIMRGMKGRVF